MRVLHVASVYGYWGELHPNCLDVEDKGQVGGGETAMLYACFELAALGHDVTCAFRCKPQKYRGVTFRPTREIEDLLYNEEWDAIVSWDNVEPLLPLQGEGVRLVCSNQMNGISPLAQGNTEILFVSPSRTHARLMHYRYGIPIENFNAIPNAVDPAWYDFEGSSRNPFSVMYASSPDRGLHHLLQLWPQIRASEARAELHVYYEISRWLSMCESIPHIAPEMAGLAKMIRRFRYALDASDGVFWEGAKHPRQVARDMLRTGVLAYPCDTIFFTEGFGTTPMQAHIAGARVILSDTDAFPDVYGEAEPGEEAGLPLVGSGGEPNPLVPRTEIHEQFVPRVVEAMASMAGRRGWSWSSAASAQQLADRYSWQRVGQMWDAVIRGERVFWPEGKWKP